MGWLREIMSVILWASDGVGTDATQRFCFCVICVGWRCHDGTVYVMAAERRRLVGVVCAQIYTPRADAKDAGRTYVDYGVLPSAQQSIS